MAKSITLPTTLPELMSAEGKEAIRRAEQVLNALQSLTFVVVDTSGREHRGVLEVSASTAVVRVRL